MNNEVVNALLFNEDLIKFLLSDLGIPHLSVVFEEL